MAGAASANAEDLRGALTQAYQTNPSLQAARAQQRATDEGVPIARASGLPSLSGTATETEFLKQNGNSSTSVDRSLSAGISLGVPLYAGGAVRKFDPARRKPAWMPARPICAGSKPVVFNQVVASYMDVILSEAVVGLNRNTVEVLEVNLQATRDRFEIGDLTRTRRCAVASPIIAGQGRSAFGAIKPDRCPRALYPGGWQGTRRAGTAAATARTARIAAGRG